VEVYPGVKWKDVAISEICNIGCCFNINTLIQADRTQLNSENLKPGTSILTLDIDSQKIIECEISNVIQMKHSKMIRVTTQNHSIEITPYHPLYIQDQGFTSLLKLKKDQNLDSYEKLTENLWVLVWNENDKCLKYEKIDNIELLFGDFTTFSILSIKQANNYIMNGFVSTTDSKK
jgi:intein/homing endonuclease